MEFNDLDGFEDIMRAREAQEKLTKLYQNATTYAAIRDEEHLRQELGKIEKIISQQVESAEDSWANFQWAIKDPALGNDMRQELFEAYPFYKTQLKAAEVAAREYRRSAEKLLTLCRRRTAA